MRSREDKKRERKQRDSGRLAKSPNCSITSCLTSFSCGSSILPSGLRIKSVVLMRVSENAVLVYPDLAACKEKSFDPVPSTHTAPRSGLCPSTARRGARFSWRTSASLRGVRVGCRRSRSGSSRDPCSRFRGVASWARVCSRVGTTAGGEAGLRAVVCEVAADVEAMQHQLMVAAEDERRAASLPSW